MASFVRLDIRHCTFLACVLIDTLLLASAANIAKPSPELQNELQQLVEKLYLNITHDPHNYVGVGQMRRLTNSFKGFHMSGYFDKSPWNADGSKLLLQQTPQYTEHMSILEALQIGVVHLDDPHSPRLEFLTNTTAWNHQQGTMLQWLGWSKSLIVFNTRSSSSHPDAHGFAGVIYDIAKRQTVATLPMPVYSLNAFGTVATSLNFARLYVTRRDYGYVVDNAAQDAQRAKSCPDDDGIWVMENIQEPAKVKPRLLVSIRKVFDTVLRLPANDTHTSLPYPPKTQNWNAEVIERDCAHWFNHAQLNREGTKVLFLYRVGHCRQHIRGWATFPMTIDIATGELWRVPLAHGSHHDFGWMDNLISCDNLGYIYAKPKTFATALKKPAAVANGADGHCSFAPTSNEFLLSDTYPKKSAEFPAPTRTLFTWDLFRNNLSIIGHFAPVKEGKYMATRVDLHPRWSRDGRYVCWDSTHEGLGRQVYVAKVYDKALARPGVDVPTQPPRKIYMDLGARSGDTIEKFLQSKVDGADYIFHAFECNPENMDIIRSALGKISEKYKVPSQQLILVEAAAWTSDGELTFNLDSRGVGYDGKPGKTGGSLFTSPHAKGNKVTVPARDFSAYLEANANYVDHVACKIDVEGAEYELLVHLIRKGTIILCDVVYIEWHGRFRREWAEWNNTFTAMLTRLEIPVVKIA